MTMTSCLSIKPCRPEDLDAVLSLLFHPELAGWRGHADLDAEALEWRVAARDLVKTSNHCRLFAVARLSKNNRLAGVLNVDNGNLAYAIAPKLQGRGLGTELVATGCKMAKRNIGLKRLQAVVARDNTPSRRLLERLEFTFSELISVPIPPTQHLQTMLLYVKDYSSCVPAMLKDELYRC